MEPFEFTHHCAMLFCNKLNFLPTKCDHCRGVFCFEHISYSNHRCERRGFDDSQVPICPLCDTAVPFKRHDSLDISVTVHIDQQCESDLAVERRKGQDIALIPFYPPKNESLLFL